jgi:hypothetical protein
MRRGTGLRRMLTVPVIMLILTSRGRCFDVNTVRDILEGIFGIKLTASVV